MSLLTAFPENVYPTHPLASALRGASFTIERALALMWLAQATYETDADNPDSDVPRKLERLLAQWQLRLLARLSAGGTEGFIAESDDVIVIAFAGTDPVVEAHWIMDFDIRLGPNGVHRGFKAGVQNVWPMLASTLAGTTKPIHLTGHSLGGALAIVAAWRLTGVGGPIPVDRIAAITTFGTPRVGNAGFADAYRSQGLWSRTFGLRYGADIVPFLPPAIGRLPPFQTVGLTLSCPHGGLFAETPPPTTATDDRPEMAALLSGWRVLLRLGVRQHPTALLVDYLPVLLRDHVPDRYLEALGWRFTRSAMADRVISAAEVVAFLRTGQAILTAGGLRLSSILNNFVAERRPPD